MAPPLPPVYNLVATPGNSQMLLTWNAPTTNQYSGSVLAYQIIASLDGTWVVNTTTTQKSYTITGLTNGSQYQFSVIAQYTAGNSAFTSVFATPISISCYSKETDILCFDAESNSEKYINITNLSPKQLVKIYPTGYKAIQHIGYHDITQQASSETAWYNKFYIVPQTNYSKDLIVSGYHSVLVDNISSDVISQYEKHDVELKEIQDKKLLVVGLASEYKVTSEVIDKYYHFVLDNENEKGQYGIWANNILTESQSYHDFKKHKFTEL